MLAARVGAGAASRGGDRVRADYAPEHLLLVGRRRGRAPCAMPAPCSSASGPVAHDYDGAPTLPTAGLRALPGSRPWISCDGRRGSGSSRRPRASRRRGRIAAPRTARACLRRRSAGSAGAPNPERPRPPGRLPRAASTTGRSPARSTPATTPTCSGAAGRRARSRRGAAVTRYPPCTRAARWRARGYVGRPDASSRAAARTTC
jgi:hypothetical protein